MRRLACTLDEQAEANICATIFARREYVIGCNYYSVRRPMILMDHFVEAALRADIARVQFCSGTLAFHRNPSTMTVRRQGKGSTHGGHYRALD